MSKSILALVGIVLIWGIFTSCSDRRYTEEGIMEIVRETDSLLVNLSGNNYSWGSRKAFSSILAYFPAPDIIFLNEKYNHRNADEEFNFYYFADGALVHFVRKKLSYSKQNGQKMGKKLLNLKLYIDPDGDIIRYQKFINNRAVTFEDDELEKILFHSNELYSIVGDSKK